MREKAKGLAHNTHLQKLYLQRTNITAACVPAFLESITKQRKLLGLRLNNNHLEDAVLQEVTAVMSSYLSAQASHVSHLLYDLAIYKHYLKLKIQNRIKG